MLAIVMYICYSTVVELLIWVGCIVYQVICRVTGTRPRVSTSDSIAYMKILIVMYAYADWCYHLDPVWPYPLRQDPLARSCTP